ncbi:MAG: gamma carbonic anhydrase family protein [Thermomicrobiales bacterium]|nr:gamma carbonic anhydrase family protein [Thermomicrobiales bacterium]
MSQADFAHRFPGAIILPYQGVWPTIADSAFVAPGAVVIGNVTVGGESSIWFHTVVRGDIAPITIGNRTSVQDCTLVHVNMDAPTIIGDDVTIGHSALVHGTTIHDGVLVGMGAIIMSYSEVGTGAVIAAGAVITERTVVPPHAVMVGMPAKQRSALDETQASHLAAIPGRYVRVSRQYIHELGELEEKHEH